MIEHHVSSVQSFEMLSTTEEETYIRRRQVLIERMHYPPPTAAEIGRRLGLPKSVVAEDLTALRTQMSADDFAKDNHSRIGRALAELEAVAFKIMDEIDQLDPKRQSAERSSLYGKFTTLMLARNDMMVATGMIKRAPVEVSTINTTIDMTHTTVDDRIKQILAQREPKKVAPIDIQAPSGHDLV